MVTGAGPQSKVMIPPAPTALTTASDVQLLAVPVPTTRVGWLVSAASASAGTRAPPSGLPGLGRLRAAAWVGVGEALAGAGEAAADVGTPATTERCGVTTGAAGVSLPHPATTRHNTAATAVPGRRTGRW